MKTVPCLLVTTILALGFTHAYAQVVVKHIQTESSPIATGVWAGDTLYLSGQLASPVKPADPAKSTAAVYGDTQTQALSAFTKIQALLKAQGLDMKDVIKMTVFLAGDPAKEGKLDFPGLQASYTNSLALPHSRTNLPAAPCRWPLLQPLGLCSK